MFLDSIINLILDMAMIQQVEDLMLKLLVMVLIVLVSPMPEPLIGMVMKDSRVVYYQWQTIFKHLVIQRINGKNYI